MMEEAKDKEAKAGKTQSNQKVAPEKFIEKAQNTLKTEPEAQEIKSERKVCVNISAVANRIIIATAHSLIEINRKESKRQFEKPEATQNPELSSSIMIDRRQVK